MDLILLAFTWLDCSFFPGYHRWHHAPVRYPALLQDLARVISPSSWLAGSYVFILWLQGAWGDYSANMFMSL